MKIKLVELRRQRNISIGIKQGLLRLQAIIEHFEAAKRDECEARQKLTSFVALSAASSCKRQVSAPPPAPTGSPKSAKEKEEGEAIEPPKVLPVLWHRDEHRGDSTRSWLRRL